MANNKPAYTLDDYVDIDGHIEFANSLINKYDWDKHTHASLTSQLKRIRNKQTDKFLNLSVIGEFSTGKSSFINALLGEELLVSSAIQGTTVVNTVIEYYHEPVLYVQKKDNTHEVIQAESIESLSRVLSDVTTNPQTAKSTKLVRVGLPCNLLKGGIRIIDTPGTNSIDSWHEDVTKEALRELSDLSIILTDGIHPMSQTLIEFVEDNLSEIYSQCAFVVTYYDKIHRTERESVLSFVRKKLINDLDVSEPKVFPFVAPALIAHNAGKRVLIEQDEMVSISTRSRDAIFNLMNKKRALAQIKKLLTLTKLIFASLEDSIITRKQEQEDAYSILLKSKQTSLDPFVKDGKARHCRNFELGARDIRDNFAHQISLEIKNSKSKIHSAIKTCKGLTADDIKNFISTEVPKLCVAEAEKVKALAIKLSEQLSDKYIDVMANFQREFKHQYNKLGILDINLDNIKIESPVKVSIPLDTLHSSLQYMSEAVSHENWMMGGGGVAGAAIGTAILPGVGTVIGGLLGAFVGAINTPTTDELKKNASEKLSTQLDSAFRVLEDECLSAFERNVKNHSDSIRLEIDRYLAAYKTTVDRMIAEHNSLIEKTESEINKVNNDLKLLSLRREQLKSVSDNLHKLI